MKQKLRNSLKYSTYRQFVRAKRFVLNRRGDGVHSPYAFRLISKVVRNPYPYTCFEPLARETRVLGQALRTEFGDRCIYRRRILELIFRLVIDLRPQRIVLLAPKGSLVPRYLQATSLSLQMTHISSLDSLEAVAVESADFVIVEDIPKGDMRQLERMFIAARTEGVLRQVLINRSNPMLRRYSQPIRSALRPNVIFDFLRLELWVWRDATTPGRYKVYY
ncbi:MAG: hypothetical protein Q4A64_06290 [Porphyromonadaceae bacterium]|nr:hypothetical protein [Porphyromonadaceae bacterium]